MRHIAHMPGSGSPELPSPELIVCQHGAEAMWMDLQ